MFIALERLLKPDQGYRQVFQVQGRGLLQLPLAYAGDRVGIDL